MSLREPWGRALAQLDYALQPIVNVHTGVCFAVEALLRGCDRAGFGAIPDLFDAACRDGVLFQLDAHLREMALDKLTRIPFHRALKLFFNLDGRVILMPDYHAGITLQLLKNRGLSPSHLCFELSERHEITSRVKTTSVLQQYRNQAFQIAIDDYGTGFSGLRLLYDSEPNYIKIDRFFISNIAQDVRKKYVLSHMVRLAHALGILVIAEGVETEPEFHACRDAGCDFVQGVLIQEPVVDVGRVRQKSDRVAGMSGGDRRRVPSDRSILTERIEPLIPICITDSETKKPRTMADVFELFRTGQDEILVPVLNPSREPLGVIREKDLKRYVYSPYGKDLLLNQANRAILQEFITRLPVVEIDTRLEGILETYSSCEDVEGLLVTENSRYIGFLSAGSLIRVLNEKDMMLARDQNPLTRLPGNTVIHEYVARAMDAEGDFLIAHFDFDNFKPFNDTYGFRLGDRAILMFADLLRETLHPPDCFAGHIGGDDFIVGFALKGEIGFAQGVSFVRHVIRRFAQDVASLYTPEDRKRGYIVSEAREGGHRTFPLLSVSAGLILIDADLRSESGGEIGRLAAELKKRAKASPDHLAFSFRHPRLAEPFDFAPHPAAGEAAPPTEVLAPEERTLT